MTAASPRSLESRTDSSSSHGPVHASEFSRRDSSGTMTIQLEPGALVVASTVRRFSGLRLQQTAVTRTSLHRVRAPSRSISLLLTLRGSSAQFVDGYELTTDRCVFLEEGALAELIAHAGSSWVLISLPAGLMGATERSCTAGQIQLHGGARLVTRPSNACVALADTAANALFSWRASTARALAISVLQDSADALMNGAPCNARDDGARRRIAVERARRYIWEHLADPIRLADLCSHAHLQPRSLEYGFRRLVRLAPMAYVRMLRLGQVRTQLLQGGEATRSISEIALDAGFSHLSQFVVDYKRVFGETPSTTRGSVLRPARIEARRRWLTKPRRSTGAAMPWASPLAALPAPG
jgi:AraC-like DNA-binding protein